jgi:hypothetical protein
LYESQCSVSSEQQGAFGSPNGLPQMTLVVIGQQPSRLQNEPVSQHPIPAHSNWPGGQPQGSVWQTPSQQCFPASQQPLPQQAAPAAQQ